MHSSEPLHGGELIDCAKANANQTMEVVSELCGYGQDITMFEQELRKAFKSMGVKIETFADLKANPYINQYKNGVIAPETPNQL
jgi:hypothetical protein